MCTISAKKCHMQGSFCCTVVQPKNRLKKHKIDVQKFHYNFMISSKQTAYVGKKGKKKMEKPSTEQDSNSRHLENEILWLIATTVSPQYDDINNQDSRHERNSRKCHLSRSCCAPKTSQENQFRNDIRASRRLKQISKRFPSRRVTR